MLNHTYISLNLFSKINSIFSAVKFLGILALHKHRSNSTEEVCVSTNPDTIALFKKLGIEKENLK